MRTSKTSSMIAQETASSLAPGNRWVLVNHFLQTMTVQICDWLQLSILTNRFLTSLPCQPPGMTDNYTPALCELWAECLWAQTWLETLNRWLHHGRLCQSSACTTTTHNLQSVAGTNRTPPHTVSSPVMLMNGRKFGVHVRCHNLWVWCF